jgi:hypothetical protein
MGFARVNRSEDRNQLKGEVNFMHQSNAEQEHPGNGLGGEMTLQLTWETTAKRVSFRPEVCVEVRTDRK